MVPLRKKIVYGCVWSESEQNSCKAISDDAMREITSVCRDFSLSKTLVEFIDWVARYTLSHPGAVLKLALPLRSYDRKKEPAYTIDREKFLEIAQKKTIDPKSPIGALVAAEETTAWGESYNDIAMPLSDWQRATKLSKTSLQSLIKNKMFIHADERTNDALKIPIADRAQPRTTGLEFLSSSIHLTDDQDSVFSEISEFLCKDKFTSILLSGPTGSGKTEVCLKACEQVALKKKQALVLLPEIALVKQWSERILKYFGAAPCEWHSNITPSKRSAAFFSIAEGRSKIIIGARSALFLPYKSLGLIIVDEEHDHTYKQEDRVLYHARDMAIVRAKLEKCTAILASATPSIETLYNCNSGKFKNVRLASRYGSGTMPSIKIIDMTKCESWLSPELHSAVKKNLEDKNQSLIFLNKRGYSSLFFCKSCGFRALCHRCKTYLCVHRYGPLCKNRAEDSLVCHYCGFNIKVPDICPRCKSYKGVSLYGIGVEKAKEELSKMFPSARISLFSSDHLSSEKQLSDTISQIKENKVDIIVGTQMIAKGHHFPNLTCVGVIDADSSLAVTDLRINEKMYNVISQVSGRAGREEKPGEVYIQTRSAQNPVLVSIVNGDFEKFAQQETKNRQDYGWPPFSRLIAVTITATKDEDAHSAADALSKAAPKYSDIDILGPAPAALSPLRGMHRWRFLVKAPKNVNLQAIVKNWIESCKLAKNIRIQTDVDPYNFL